jgi:dTDP-4-amino-4,6-dideoxygalactose transaminase
MQFIDLNAQYQKIKDLVDSKVLKVLESGAYIGGPEITELEEKLAEFAGVKHCLACSNGTDALLIPLMAWDINPGDAVFTTSFTFISSGEVVALRGATPVFVDINPDTYNMCPDSLEKTIQKVLNETDLKPKAIIPVDLFGLSADYYKINAIAKKYNLKVLEDGAQSFGGKYNGKRTGSFGDAAATSFYPAKPLGAYGDAGASFTNDDELINIYRSIRVHGSGTDKYDNVRIGINGRMSTIQAAILLAKLTIFEDELIARDKIANNYHSLLKDKVKIPVIPENYFSAWAQYTVQVESSEKRNEIFNRFKENGVPYSVFYPIPLHKQTAYKNICITAEDMSKSEYAAERVFSIPMHPYLNEEDQEKIANLIY